MTDPLKPQVLERGDGLDYVRRMAKPESADLGVRREVVRAFMNELLDEYIAAGELRRIVRSVRQSVAEGDRSSLCPSGLMGALADELAGQLLGEVAMLEPNEPSSDECQAAEEAFWNEPSWRRPLGSEEKGE